MSMWQYHQIITCELTRSWLSTLLSDCKSLYSMLPDCKSGRTARKKPVQKVGARMFRRICNPTEVNIRIFNPIKCALNCWLSTLLSDCTSLCSMLPDFKSGRTAHRFLHPGCGQCCQRRRLLHWGDIHDVSPYGKWRLSHRRLGYVRTCTKEVPTGNGGCRTGRKWRLSHRLPHLFSSFFRNACVFLFLHQQVFFKLFISFY